MAVKNGVFYQHTTDDNLIGANPQNGVRYVSANGYAPGGSSLNAGNPQVGDAYLKVLDQQASAPAAAGAQSSFADSGSMKAVSAPTNMILDPNKNNAPTNMILDPNAPQTITPYGNGATPTYSDYMGVQYTTSRPGDFQYGDAPTFTDPYDPAGKSQAYNDLLQNQFTYEKYPEYTDRLQGTWDAQLAAAQAAANRQFTYDASTDPVYQAYLKQYAREGQRASANTLGQAAAMTGGRPSSYAVSAASQAGNYYAAQAADKLPELYQQAYQRYLQDYQNKLGLLSAINQRANTEQGIWAGNAENHRWGVNTDLGIYNDRIQNAYNAAALERSLSNDAFNQYQTALDQYNKDKNFAYGQNTDDINWEADAENTTYNRSEAEKQYADERADYEFNKALQLAQLGDYSALEALGYDTSYIRAMNEAALADQKAQTAARLMKGSGSSGSSGSGSSGLTIGGEPVLDEEVTEEGFDEETSARIDSILNAANLKGMAVTNKADWQFLLDTLGEEWLNEYGYKFGEGEANKKLSTSQDKRAVYYKQLYPDGIVTNLSDWSAICGIYGNAANAQKQGGFSFVGNYNETAQSDKGATTYNEKNVSTYDLANPPKEEIVGPMPGYGNNKLMPYQEIGTAARTGSMPVTSKTGGIRTGGIRTGSAAGSKSATASSKTGTAQSKLGTSSAAKTETAETDFTNGRKFAGAADAMKFASYFGVPTNRQKYYNEREFNTYKMSNADPSLREYNTYQDYLTGYTNYLITEYGAKV